MATVEISQGGSANASMKLRITYTSGNGNISITNLEGYRDSYGPTQDQNANNRIYINIGGTTYTVSATNNNIIFGKASWVQFWSGTASKASEGPTNVTVTFYSANGNGNVQNSLFSTTIDAGYSNPTLTINNAGSSENNKATISSTGLTFNVSIGNMAGRTGKLYLDGVEYATKTGDTTWNVTLTSSQAVAYLNNNPNVSTFTIALSFVINDATLSDSKTLYVKMDDAIKPTISGITITSTPINSSLSTLNNIPVKTLTKPTVTFTAAGAYNSSIRTYEIVSFGDYPVMPAPFETATYNSSIAYPTSGTYNIVGCVTDSRGRKSNNTNGTSITVIDYNVPSVTFTVDRCNSSGTLSNEGTYAKVTINYSFSSITYNGTAKNTKNIWYRYHNGTAWQNWTQVTLSAWSGTFTSSAISGFSASSSYKFEVKYEDIATNNADSPLEQTLPPAFTLISRYHGGKGIAFGEVATADGFKVSMVSNFTGNVKLPALNKITSNDTALSTAIQNAIQSSILQAAYPVGAIYISAINTSPASLFGGTWTQLKSRFLYATPEEQGTGADRGKDAMSTITGDTTSSTSVLHYHGLGSGYADIGIGWTSGWGNFLREASHGGGYTANLRMNSLPTYYGISEWCGESVALGGTTDNGENVHSHSVPYIAVYVWQRTA